MIRTFDPIDTCDRLLLVDDTVDDVTEILTIACESFGSRGSGRTTLDRGDA